MGFRLQSMRSPVTDGRRGVHSIHLTRVFFHVCYTAHCGARAGWAQGVARHKKSIIFVGQPCRHCRSHTLALHLLHPHPHRTLCAPQPHLHGCRALYPAGRSHEMRSVALLPLFDGQTSWFEYEEREESG